MEMSINNIKFNYLYRDGSNYKNYISIVFENPNNIPLSQIESSIRDNLFDGEYFYADKWNLPTLFFEEKNCDDHEFHEFGGLQITSEHHDNKTVDELIFKITRCPKN